MKNIEINFGGFYGSTHEIYIDSMVENYFDGDEVIPDNINYPLIFNEYVKFYVEDLNEFLNDEFEIDVKFHNIILQSPKFYNYSTDIILSSISDMNSNKLIDLFQDDEEFLILLENKTTSCDGYISFYSYDEILSDNHGILINYIFDYIVELFNESVMDYYDRNNRHELLYHMDIFKGT